MATDIFHAGLKAVNPDVCLDRHIRWIDGRLQVGNQQFSMNNINRIYLVSIGKAAAVMAQHAEEVLKNHIHAGLVITKYGHGFDLNQCRIMEAGHPLPDANGVSATKALLDLVSDANANDLVLCMISGGASALTPAPAEGITLEEKRLTTKLLLECGADIHQINTIRKHLSQFKGGQLCRHIKGARVISLILSDVIGNDLDIIGSGPTVPDNSTFKDCKKIFEHFDLWHHIPGAVSCCINKGIAGKILETPKPNDSLFTNVENRIIGSVSDALSAAQKEAVCQGFTPLVLSSTIQGEAREAAKVLCAIAKEIRISGNPVSPPACLLSGGETTVTIKGNGKGGRNMELALAAGIELAGTASTLLLSAGTDGTDGPTNAAGAFSDSSTVSRAASAGISARNHLIRNDAYPFFDTLGDLLITGPTYTNVMDLQIILVDEHR